VYIQPGDNITLIGHFYDGQGNELDPPYLEVIYNEPFEPGYPPTTTPAVTTTPVTTTTVTTPSEDQKLLECLAGGPCSSCPGTLCNDRYDPSIRIYPLSPYLDADGNCLSPLVFSSADGMTMVLLPLSTQLSWSGEYHYLEIAEVDPPNALDGSVVVGSAYELGPEDMQFSSSLELSLSYNPAGLSPGAAEDDLYLGLWNPVTHAWEPVVATLRTAENVVVGQLSHFSIYGVISPPAPAPTTTAVTTTVQTTISSSTTTAVSTATLPSLAVITSHPENMTTDSSWYANLTGDLNSFVSSVAPPVTVIMISVVTCIGLLRWMR
jgi:hypothetical protein